MDSEGLEKAVFVYRPVGVRAAALWGYLVLSLMSALILGVGLGGAPGGGMAAGISILGLWISLRAWRMTFVVTQQGVFVRNRWRSRAFVWPEIEAFKVRRLFTGGAIPVHVIGVQLRASSVVFPAQVTSGKGNREAFLECLRAESSRHGVRLEVSAQDLRTNDGWLRRMRSG